MNKLYYEKLINMMQLEGIDAFLVVPSEELMFIAGFSPYLCERFQGLFIKQNGDHFYFCNQLSKEEVEDHLPPEKVYGWYDYENFTDVLAEVLDKEDMLNKRIGVNSTARAFNILDIMEEVPVTFFNGKTQLESIRLVKSKEEIEFLKEAAKRTDSVMEETLTFIKPGVSESEIIDKVNELFIKKEMVPEFAIIATGPNAALPHYSGSERVVQEKDVVLLDIGGKYKGLCSDMTRTVFVGGMTEEELIAYHAVLDSINKGIEMVSVGVEAKTVDAEARKIIEETGYGNFFKTRLGHGIGYSVHEAPYINGNNDLCLGEGMAFSIEPGIYLKDKFGIRIEDIVIIEEGKGVPINKMTRDPIIL